MRKSLWSPDEDEKLRCYVATHGCGNWSDVAKHTGLHRCGKSCRLRWINYLRPDLKRGPFTAHEVRLVVNLHKTMGNSWSKIAAQLPGRTDNDVKNFWHSYTRSRRIQQQQQQQQANKAHQSSKEGNNDQQGSSSNEQFHNGNMHRNGINEQRQNVINNSAQYEGVLQLHSLVQAGSIKGLAGLCKNVNNIPNLQIFSGCKPSEPYSNALAHTHKSSNIIFNPHPDHNIVAPPLDHQPGSHVLLTDKANITHPLTQYLQPPNSQDTSISALIYKGFPPHLFSDQCCSKVSSMSFQKFPPLNDQASDNYSTIIPAQLSGSHVIADATVKLKTAQSTISPLISHVRPHHPHGLFVDYPAVSFDSASSLPATVSYAASKHEASAADIKPPEGLESVIWSYLKGQPEPSSSTSPGTSDDYNKAHFVTSNHDHYHINQVIKPQLEVSNCISSDHHPHHPQVSSDQYINTESLSYTSPTNMQCLQAHYLADCFS